MGPPPPGPGSLLPRVWASSPLPPADCGSPGRVLFSWNVRGSVDGKRLEHLLPTVSVSSGARSQEPAWSPWCFIPISVSKGGCRAGRQETWVQSPAPCPASLSLRVPSCQVRGWDYVITKAPSSSKKSPPDLGPAAIHALKHNLLSLWTRSAVVRGGGRPPSAGPRVQGSPRELASLPELCSPVARKGGFPKCEPWLLRVISGLYSPECVRARLGDGERGRGKVEIGRLLSLCSGKQILRDDDRGCFEKVFPSSSLSTVLWKLLDITVGQMVGLMPCALPCWLCLWASDLCSPGLGVLVCKMGMITVPPA